MLAERPTVQYKECSMYKRGHRDVAPGMGNKEYLGNGMELGEFFACAPHFLDQIEDLDRVQLITHTRSYGEDYPGGECFTMTEHEALVGLNDFLLLVQDSSSRYSELADTLRRTLTFIGRKEYDRAVNGIVGRWMRLLDSDNSLLIHVIADGLMADPCYMGSVKSGDYLIAGILSVLNDQEWAQYGERIIFGDPCGAIKSGHKVRTIILDDWTISGAQLRSMHDFSIMRYPEIRNSIEVQLIVANPSIIRQGLQVSHNKPTVPLHAYYSAHESGMAGTGSHITGFHSSVDFDFENILRAMAKDMSRLTGESVPMPPLTNIVRPYRSGYR